VNELTLEPGKYYGFTYTVVDAGAQLFDLSWATGSTYLWNTS
jgi:hypothetical protein